MASDLIEQSPERIRIEEGIHGRFLEGSAGGEDDCVLTFWTDGESPMPITLEAAEQLHRWIGQRLLAAKLRTAR